MSTQLDRTPDNVWSGQTARDVLPRRPVVEFLTSVVLNYVGRDSPVDIAVLAQAIGPTSAGGLTEGLQAKDGTGVRPGDRPQH
jgi:hypothetical protein